MNDQSSIYSLKALLTKQPTAIASVIRQILLTLVLAGVFPNLSVQLLAGIAMAVELGLSLFVWASVVPTAKIKEEQLTILEQVTPEVPPPPVPGDATGPR